MGKRTSIGQRSRDAVNSIREALYLRDDYRCVVAQTDAGYDSPCEGSVSVQHRVGRGAGGSALFDDPSYLITMCIKHNTLAESSADFAETCRRNGWKLPRNRAHVDPVAVPVRYWDGWYELEAGHCFRTRVYGPHAVDRITSFLHQPKVDAESTSEGGRA